MTPPISPTTALAVLLLVATPSVGLAEGAAPVIPAPVPSAPEVPAADAQRDFYRELLEEERTDVVSIPALPELPKLAPPAAPDES